MCWEEGAGGVGKLCWRCAGEEPVLLMCLRVSGYVRGGAGEVPERCCRGAGEVLVKCWIGAGEMLGRCGRGAGEVPGEVLGRCWRGARSRKRRGVLGSGALGCRALPANELVQWLIRRDGSRHVALCGVLQCKLLPEAVEDAGEVWGRWWIGAGKVLGSPWDVLDRFGQGAGEMLGSRWRGAGEELARCWGGAGDLLGSCWRISYVYRTSKTFRNNSNLQRPPDVSYPAPPPPLHKQKRFTLRLFG